MTREKDPLLEMLDNAPIDDEPRTPEDEAASKELHEKIGDPPTSERIEQAEKDGDLIPGEELMRRLGLAKKDKAK